MPLPAAVRRDRRAYNKKLNPPVFPLKRCLNDNKQFRQTRPNRKFCCQKCKDEYNRYGSAFGPLRLKLEKMVHAWMKSYQLDIDQNIIRLTARLDEISGRLDRMEEFRAYIMESAEKEKEPHAATKPAPSFPRRYLKR
jgi:collagenase-like PrtC family protease